MEIKKVLVPVDFSEASRAAFSHAATVARGCCAEVHLLHVVDLPAEIDDEILVADPDTKDKMLQMKQQAFTEAEQRMAAFEATVDAAGITVRRYYSLGDVFRAIVKSVDEQAANLVVVGSKRRAGGLERLHLGGIAYRLVRGVACPVTVVRA